MGLTRRTELRANPETTRAWRDRSRKPLARKTELRSKTPLKPGKGTTPERDRAVKVAFERHGHRCIAAELVPEVACWGPLHPHEPRTRKRGGDVEDPDQIVPICAQHHDWAHHREQTRAHELGLLIHSWEDTPMSTCPDHGRRLVVDDAWEDSDPDRRGEPAVAMRVLVCPVSGCDVGLIDREDRTP